MKHSFYNRRYKLTLILTLTTNKETKAHTMGKIDTGTQNDSQSIREVIPEDTT